MKYQKEILESTKKFLKSLENSGFFEDNIFLSKGELLKELRFEMTEKLKQTGDSVLSKEEFESICVKLNQKAISNTLSVLIEANIVNMGVNSVGTILYSLNKNFKYEGL